MGLVKIENEFGSATVTAHAGATLRSLRVRVGGAEHELLSGGLNDRLDDAQTPSGVGSFIMAPWVNRIHRGLLVTDDGEFELPVNSGEHAIHGTVRHREWEIVSQDSDSAVLQVALQEPWPFRGYVTYRISLEGASLRQTLEVRAADGERRFQSGVGWHPWFRRSLGSDELSVRADVAGQWELDSKIVPTGRLIKTDATRKLREGGRYSVGEVDGCFRFGDARTAEVRWPEVTLNMESSNEVTHVMVYSPKDSICVEPQTTTVNAFQLAARGIEQTGTRTVAPGAPLFATTVWSWSDESANHGSTIR